MELSSLHAAELSSLHAAELSALQADVELSPVRVDMQLHTNGAVVAAFL
jgi:hypothetical protein